MHSCTNVPISQVKRVKVVNDVLQDCKVMCIALTGL